MNVLDAIKSRHSSRQGFDAGRPLSASELDILLEAAQAAPTFCNAQNFEIVVVDDPQILGQICELPADISPQYVHATFDHLAFGEEKWIKGGVGMLATDSPFMNAVDEEWSVRDNLSKQLARLGVRLDRHQTLLFILYDPTNVMRGSMNDELQLLSMGCILENLWLACEGAGLGLMMMTPLSDRTTEQHLRSILRIPVSRRIGFACAVGHPLGDSPASRTVRRNLADFVHRGRYGNTTS